MIARRRTSLLATSSISIVALLAACSSSRSEDPTGTTSAAVSEKGAIHCSAEADEHSSEGKSDEEARAEGAASAEPTAWGDGQKHAAVAHIRVLGLNDFHGQIMAGIKPGEFGRSFTDLTNPKLRHPVGGAAVLSSWLKDAQATAPAGPESVIITHSGDFVGASVPQSGLLRDEPAILWFNLLANDSCRQWQVANAEGRYAAQGGGLSKRCNMVAGIGNHEFDKGRDELFRKVYGGNSSVGPYIVEDWKGAKYPYVAANVIDNATGKTLFRPYEIKTIDGEKIAFIGAVTKNTPSAVMPEAITGLTFLDEATAINSYVGEIQAQGVHAIVVLLHEGGKQALYVTPTDPLRKDVVGPVKAIVANLNADIDVVLSGHSHDFTNALLPNAGGKPTLVTQAFSYGMAFAQIDLDIDNETHDIVGKVGKVQIAWGDSGPGLTPDPEAKALVDAAVAATGPKLNEIVGRAAVDLLGPRSGVVGAKNKAGETNLGDLIADAQRVQTGAPIAFMNPGGIRADVLAGSIAWGQLYAVQPFANDLITETLTGGQIWTALRQQWTGKNVGSATKILQISGLSYAYGCITSCTTVTATTTYKVYWVKDGSGQDIPDDASRSYNVVVNAFLAAGGDNFPALSGSNKITRMVDLDALVDYIRAKGTVGGPIDSRINLVSPPPATP